MGQYYQPTSLTKKEHVYSHDYGNGLKLMEHSYIGNDFMMVIENLLSEAGRWYKNKIVWAGDYADNEKGKKKNIYGLINKVIKPKFKKVKFRYIINHTTKEYIDKNEIKEFEKGWKIHPLSLLTCEGNGRGGGDYRGEDPRIGIWSRHKISVDNNVPKGYEKIDGNFVEER